MKIFLGISEALVVGYGCAKEIVDGCANLQVFSGAAHVDRE